ncbi:hypothetical protein EMCRGX_G005366 [Ephydatia muelleri]
METQITSNEKIDCTVRKENLSEPRSDKRKESYESIVVDELKLIRVAVEGILTHLRTNSNTVQPTSTTQFQPASIAQVQCTSTVPVISPSNSTTLACSSDCAQPVGLCGTSHLPEYFRAKSGVDLLKVRGTTVVKYALGLMDALYTEEELSTCSFVPVGKSTTSAKPPLSPTRMTLLEGDQDHGHDHGSRRQDHGHKETMIMGQGGKIMATRRPRSWVKETKIMAMIMGQVCKILYKILGKTVWNLAAIIHSILILAMILVMFLVKIFSLGCTVQKRSIR